MFENIKGEIGYQWHEFWNDTFHNSKVNRFIVKTSRKWKYAILIRVEYPLRWAVDLYPLRCKCGFVGLTSEWDMGSPVEGQGMICPECGRDPI